jgi:hypothetical protein
MCTQTADRADKADSEYGAYSVLSDVLAKNEAGTVPVSALCSRITVRVLTRLPSAGGMRPVSELYPESLQTEKHQHLPLHLPLAA